MGNSLLSIPMSKQFLQQPQAPLNENFSNGYRQEGWITLQNLGLKALPGSEHDVLESTLRPKDQIINGCVAAMRLRCYTPQNQISKCLRI